MKRGAIRKRNARMVTLWIPHAMADQIDIAIQNEDSDRSKLIRRAIREKLSALNVPVEAEQSLPS